jgi:choline-phosphate cytidylyltransferase
MLICYSSSEEDNDPLTDDGASAISVLLARHATTSSTVNAPSTRTSTSHPKASNRARHQLAASLVSDDGIDSPTYDGDVESSTVGTEHNHPIKSSYHPPALHHSASSTSTLNTPATSRPTFSITSPGPSISEDTLTYRAAGLDAHPVFISQHVNAAAVPLRVPDEPQPVPAAEAAFGPSALTVENIRAFVQKAIEDDSSRTYKIQKPPIDRPVRIYADGAQMIISSISGLVPILLSRSV